MEVSENKESGVGVEVVAQIRVKRGVTAPNQTDHAENHTAEHGHDHPKHEKNRPSGRIPVSAEVICAGGAGNQ